MSTPFAELSDQAIVSPVERSWITASMARTKEITPSMCEISRLDSAIVTEDNLARLRPDLTVITTDVIYWR